jgi:hypothetical protein
MLDPERALVPSRERRRRLMRPRPGGRAHPWACGDCRVGSRRDQRPAARRLRQRGRRHRQDDARRRRPARRSPSVTRGRARHARSVRRALRWRRAVSARTGGPDLALPRRGRSRCGGVAPRERAALDPARDRTRRRGRQRSRAARARRGRATRSRTGRRRRLLGAGRRGGGRLRNPASRAPRRDVARARGRVPPHACGSRPWLPASRTRTTAPTWAKRERCSTPSAGPSGGRSSAFPPRQRAPGHARAQPVPGPFARSPRVGTRPRCGPFRAAMYQQHRRAVPDHRVVQANAIDVGVPVCRRPAPAWAAASAPPTSPAVQQRHQQRDADPPGSVQE